MTTLNIGSSVEEILDAISKLNVEWGFTFSNLIRAKGTGRCPICELLNHKSQLMWRDALQDTFWVPKREYDMMPIAWKEIANAADNFEGAFFRQALLKACRLD